MSANVAKRPARCRGAVPDDDGYGMQRCASTRFTREADGDKTVFVCKSCGHENSPVKRAVALREAECGSCHQPFLWKEELDSNFEQKAPTRCRGCEVSAKAHHYRRLAATLFEKLPELRRATAVAVDRHRARRKP